MMDKRKLKKQEKQSKLVSMCKHKGPKNKGPMIVRMGCGEKSRSVLRIRPIKDSEGDYYYPYCNFRWHQGVLLKEANICIERRCRHYRASYLVTPNFEDIKKYDN